MSEKIYISWEHYTRLIDKVITENNLSQYQYIYGIPRGGLIVALLLSYKTNMPLIYDYQIISNEHRSKVLVVDDIVDSGMTRSQFMNNKFACLHLKPWARPKPDFFARLTKDWIVYPWEEEYYDEPKEDPKVKKVTC